MGIDFTVYKGSREGKIIKDVTHKDQIKGDEVLLEVTHSGVCGTDSHYLHSDMVLGHEGIGIVKEVGPDTAVLKVGDRVGWGYVHSGCGHCKQCLSGRDIHCEQVRMYGLTDLDQGSFATHGVWKEGFLYSIPPSISDEEAAPLMCAGLTVFTVLERYKVAPVDRVGIVGIGGLGHLAIQFAAKMGCDVVAFSGHESKREEAMKLGAREFYATEGVKELKIGRPINHLFVTTSDHPDWQMYLDIMAPLGSIYPLTISDKDLQIPFPRFLAKDLKIVGSTVGSRIIIGDMLQFAADHGIRPKIQKFPLNKEGITDALDKLDKGEVRYRAVLVAGA